MSASLPVRPAVQARTARRLVVAGVLVLTAARLVYASMVGLMPQEAYYQAYAAHPALSYLDHPPMVAWWIRAGMALAGHTPLGVRLVGVLAWGVLTLVLYRLGERLFSPLAGLLVALVANTSVLFAIGAVIITPDVPLTCFWAGALLPACEVLLPDGRGPGRLGWRWLLLGALVGAAGLSKYTAALLPASLLVAALGLPRGRRALRTPAPWAGVALAAAMFTPVLVWNADHHFASFAFQTARRARGVPGFSLTLLGQYLGAQIAGVTPVIYVALLWALVVGFRRAREGDARHRLLLWATVPGLALFTVVSPFVWVKLNWVGPVYLGALVALGGLWATRWTRRTVRVTAFAGVGLALVVSVVAHLLPLVPALPVGSHADIWDGWKKLGWAANRQLHLIGPGAFVVGWDYKTAAELAWRLPAGDQRVTGANAIGGDGRAFRYWFHPETRRGATAVVVVDQRHPLFRPPLYLRRYCSRVASVAGVSVRRGQQQITRFRLWRCNDYRPPPDAGVSPLRARASRPPSPSPRRASPRGSAPPGSGG